MTLKPCSKIHLIGIGGCGMAGVAEILHQAGHLVSGSDAAASAVTERLKKQGITVRIGHSADWVEDPDRVVVSSAIRADNPELAKAHDLGIPVLHRAEMLAETSNARHSVVCLGTHGKTTTTSLLTSILIEAGLEPGFAIGATLAQTHCNACLGNGDLFVLEGDESDASFKFFQPKIVILLNIDHDHLSSYAQDLEQLKNRYQQWLSALPAKTLIIANSDDEQVNSLVPLLNHEVMTFGFNETAQYRATDTHPSGFQTCFNIKEHAITVNMPGQHNVENALAAIAAARELNVCWAAIQHALATFSGVSRRCEVHGDIEINNCHVTLLEDYGHHPAEVAATLTALRNAYPGRRVVLVYQPHRYTRTQEHFDDFVMTLTEADCLVLNEIYSAGEAPIEGVDSRALLKRINKKNQQSYYAQDLEHSHTIIKSVIRDNDVLLIQGAGSINQLIEQLLVKAPVL